MLTMCFGHSLAQDQVSFGTEKKHLQWYSCAEPEGGVRDQGWARGAQLCSLRDGAEHDAACGAARGAAEATAHGVHMDEVADPHHA